MADQIPVNSRVKLRDGVDSSFYGGFSRAGNVGVIKQRRTDQYDYPEVLVKWDEDHWAYNGAPDGWYPEGHYELLEAVPMADDNKELSETVEGLVNDFGAALAKALSNKSEEVPKAEAETNEGPSDFPFPPPGTSIPFDEARKIAQKTLEESKAFVLISLQEHPQQPGVTLPALVQHSLTDELQAVLGLHLNELSKVVSAELFLEEIARHGENDDGSEDS